MIVFVTTLVFATPVFAAQPPRDDAAGAQNATAARPARQHSRANDRPPSPRASSAPPPAALLEYLGEFDDAADGLDAMGLADPDAPLKTPPAGDKERQ